MEQERLPSLLTQLAGAFILQLSVSDGAGGAARELQAEAPPSLRPELPQAALLSPSCDLRTDVFAEERMCPIHLHGAAWGQHIRC